MVPITNTITLSPDEFFPYIGDCGRFQIILCGAISIITLPMVYHLFIMYFSTITPTWACKANASVCLLNGTLPSDDNYRCKIPRNEWYYTEDRDFSLVTQFDIDCKKEWLLYLVTSTFFVGWGVGAVLLGYMGDRFGRRKLLFPCAAAVLVFGFITPFLPHIYMIIVSRFMVGLFYPGVNIQAFILMSEMIGNKYRTLLGPIAGLSYPVAWCLLGLKAYLLKNWKILSIVCTAPYIFIFVFRSFIPESVRWLQLNGRIDEAMEVFKNIASWNRRRLPSNIALSPPQRKPRSISMLDIFLTRKIAMQTAIQGYNWLVISLSFFGLQLAANDLEGSVYRDFVLLCTSDFAAVFSFVILCKYFGRKSVSLVTLLLGAVTCLGVAFIPRKSNLDNVLRVVFGILGKYFASTSFHVMYFWSAEIFPTDVRSIGMGFLQVTSRIGAICAPWLVKGLEPLGMYIPFSVISVSLLIGSLIGMMLPETRDVPMRESNNESKKGKSNNIVVDEREMGNVANAT